MKIRIGKRKMARKSPVIKVEPPEECAGFRPVLPYNKNKAKHKARWK